MARSLFGDMDNPHLFDENEAGHYEYSTNAAGGREASGQLAFADNPERDAYAQRTAGGESRRSMGHEWGHDDGGHIIGARFGGSSGEENLTAQDSNFNRGAYKRMENGWAQHLEDGDKVFVHMETSEGDRPDAYLGYAIIEHPDGTREFETYSFLNESISQQEQWREGAEEYDENYIPEAPEEAEGSLGQDAGEGIDDDDFGIE